MVSRGECSFVSKTVMAEKAGAIAVIVTDDNAENDDVYIKMIDDNTKRKAKIPAAFLLGISGHVIQRKLREKHEEAAIINIPVNLTTVPIHKLNQPPWLICNNYLDAIEKTNIDNHSCIFRAFKSGKNENERVRVSADNLFQSPTDH
ncbi:Protease-associated domain-containing protein 1 [Armadillidium vulgare]|nr:Protease-associated domain-containing protein 1 [Armadillidium vulgare]